MPMLRLPIVNGCAVFTMDRGDRGNALSTDLVDSLAEALRSACSHPGIHTFVLRGAGRNFCTGFDLAALEQETDDSLLARFVRIELLLDALWRAPLRTVAVAQGRIIGAGADLFVACDHRLIVADATLRFPGAGFGLVLGTRRLAHRVGADLALHWAGTGATIDTATAVETGLASSRMPDGADPGSTAAWESIGAPAADRETYRNLRAALVDAHADTDLAALVRSAARPGLKDRITAYARR